MKTHWTAFDETALRASGERMLQSSREQVLGYVLKTADEGQLVEETIVQHVFINPQTGEAWELIVRPFTQRELQGIWRLMRPQ